MTEFIQFTHFRSIMNSLILPRSRTWYFHYRYCIHQSSNYAELMQKTWLAQWTIAAWRRHRRPRRAFLFLSLFSEVWNIDVECCLLLLVAIWKIWQYIRKATSSCRKRLYSKQLAFKCQITTTGSVSAR